MKIIIVLFSVIAPALLMADPPKALRRSGRLPDKGVVRDAQSLMAQIKAAQQPPSAACGVVSGVEKNPTIVEQIYLNFVDAYKVVFGDEYSEEKLLQIPDSLKITHSQYWMTPFKVDHDGDEVSLSQDSANYFANPTEESFKKLTDDIELSNKESVCDTLGASRLDLCRSQLKKVFDQLNRNDIVDTNRSIKFGSVEDWGGRYVYLLVPTKARALGDLQEGSQILIRVRTWGD